MKKISLNLNSFRIVAAILVVINHTSPFIQINESLDYLFVHILARVSVPFFLMLTGYFSFNKFLNDKNVFYSFLKETSLIYLISCIIYIPINIYAGHFTNQSVLALLKLFFIEGSMYHLWYFPALIMGAIILYILLKSSIKNKFSVVFVLYLIGIFGDNYYGLISTFPFINSFYEIIFNIFTYTRNGIFYVPLFLYLGYFIKSQSYRIKKKHLYTILMLSFFFFISEGFFIKYNNLAKHTSMYLSLIPLMFFLFTLLKDQDNKKNDAINNFTTYLYILHPLFIVAIRIIFKTLFLESYVSNNFIMFIFVLVSTSLASFLLIKLKNCQTRSQSPRVRRVIDFSALSHNLNEINKLKHENTEVMAVVKANAYGHGMIEISKHLQSIGIKTFAVASLSEALDLRKSGIKGMILILGYTPLEDLHLVLKHNLVITIPNYEYAQEIQKLSLKKRVACHIKVNTGMNRLGENYDQFSDFEKMYQLDCLNILGIFTHLAVADSENPSDIQFTHLQIQRYEELIQHLKNNNIDPGKCHTQGSYGFTNYPELNYDYIRMGILLFGVKSTLTDNCPLHLKPVMTLKTTVAMIKTVAPNESISYGRSYTCKEETRVATINIGYADGLSRSLSNTNFSVLINGNKCNVLGRICMDQMMVDIKNYDVKSGDDVIVFGPDNPVENLAEIQGTITNEVLTALTARVK